MQTVIFGRPGCPYCVRAKDLAEKLSNERDDFQYQYVDIRAEGITKEDLQQKAGKPVETVPQIFVDQRQALALRALLIFSVLWFKQTTDK